MNPHIQTPDRNRNHSRPSHLLLPLDPAKVRKDIARLRVLVTVLFISFVGLCWWSHHRHVKDINAAAKGCHDGWKVCRSFVGLPTNTDASEDFAVCGVGYQTCIEEVHNAAYLY